MILYRQPIFSADLHDGKCKISVVTPLGHALVKGDAAIEKSAVC